MTTTITARVDADKRKSAEKIFSEVGLTTSGAVNLFICAVAMTGGIPFPIVVAGRAAQDMGFQRKLADRKPDVPSGGIKIGLADNRFKFPDDFDSNFDALDSEVAELFG